MMHRGLSSDPKSRRFMVHPHDSINNRRVGTKDSRARRAAFRYVRANARAAGDDARADARAGGDDVRDDARASNHMSAPMRVQAVTMSATTRVQPVARGHPADRHISWRTVSPADGGSPPPVVPRYYWYRKAFFIKK